MGKKSQPAPPPVADPSKIIQAQADVNRIDQFTPAGSLTFGGPNRREATLEFSPEIQALFDQQLGLDSSLLGAAQNAIPGIEGLISSPLSTEGLPELPQNFDAFRDDISQQFFDRSSGLLNRQFDRDEDRLRQTLANQGLQSGGDAFGQEFGDFNIQRGETFGRLANESVLFGGQEASRALAGQAGLRSQGFQERGQVRGSQFNELASLLGLQQTQQPGLQNFFAPGQVNALDAFGLQQSGLQSNFNTQSGAASDAKGATAQLLGTLGGAGIGKGGGG